MPPHDCALLQADRPEAADRAQSAVLAAIIVSAMDAVVALDAEQRIVLFNPAAEAMFGCPAAEAVGQPLDRFLPARFRGVHRHQVAAFGATGDTARAMGHLRPLAALRSDGEECPIETTISRVAIGGHPYYAAIVRDISAREAAEAARVAAVASEAAARAEAATAAAQRDGLRTILEGMPSGVELLAAPTAGSNWPTAPSSIWSSGQDRRSACCRSTGAILPTCAPTVRPCPRPNSPACGRCAGSVCAISS